ncbi:MAG: hypothetical protein ACO1O3_06250 [Sphingobium sp.]
MSNIETQQDDEILDTIDETQVDAGHEAEVAEDDDQDDEAEAGDEEDDGEEGDEDESDDED